MRNLLLEEHSGGEVDFLIKEGTRIQQLIQVTYASALSEIERREVESLVRASEETGCRDLTVITWDCEGETEIDGKNIKVIPLWK